MADEVWVEGHKDDLDDWYKLSDAIETPFEKLCKEQGVGKELKDYLTAKEELEGKTGTEKLDAEKKLEAAKKELLNNVEHPQFKRMLEKMIERDAATTQMHEVHDRRKAMETAKASGTFNREDWERY